MLAVKVCEYKDGKEQRAPKLEKLKVYRSKGKAKSSKFFPSKAQGSTFKEGLLPYVISSPGETLQQEFQASSMSWLSRRLAACPSY